MALRKDIMWHIWKTRINFSPSMTTNQFVRPGSLKLNCHKFTSLPIENLPIKLWKSNQSKCVLLKDKWNFILWGSLWNSAYIQEISKSKMTEKNSKEIVVKHNKLWKTKKQDHRMRYIKVKNKKCNTPLQKKEKYG